jgi:predicted permease
MPILAYLFLQLFGSSTEVFYVVVPFFALPFMMDRRIVIADHNVEQNNALQFNTISTAVSFISISFWFYFLLQQKKTNLEDTAGSDISLKSRNYQTQ